MNDSSVGASGARQGSSLPCMNYMAASASQATLTTINLLSISFAPVFFIP